jgi:trimeric autotransporter adhesin
MAEATTYTVTKVADTNDGACNSDCSLREAITAANASTSTPHTITFSISGGCIGQCVIGVGSALPTITRSMTLNGTTAPLGRIGLSTNGAVVSKGLTIDADSVTVRGFGIYGFQGSGVYIVHGDGCVIAGNIFGLDQSDTLDANGTTGIHIDNGAGTRIGGTVAADRNVIAGSSDGIFLNFGTVTDTVIQGNYIGTSTNGLSATGEAVSSSADR